MAGLYPVAWLTTLSRDDLIERAGAVSAAELSERSTTHCVPASRRTAWTPAAAARLSEIKDSLRRRTQTDQEGTDPHADEGDLRPHDQAVRGASATRIRSTAGVLSVNGVGQVELARFS